MKYQYILILIVVGVIAGYCLVNIEVETGPTLGVEIDLSEPYTIVWPCEVDYIGDEGEEGLRIPPNVGRGWLDEAGGAATYKFLIPDRNEYYIWLYSRWYDECANAVYMRIDDEEKIIVGNDPVYEKWHWVRGYAVELDEGTHTLTISNHSDNIEMLKLMLINSESSVPEDSEIVFSDLFYDGFDGCDEGNFSSWEVVNGQWQVMDPILQSCVAQNALKGISEPENEAMIIYSDEDWLNYSFDMEIKLEAFEPEESELRICFGIQDLDNYYYLSLTSEKQEASSITATLNRKASGEYIVLERFTIPWEKSDWERIQIRGNHDNIDFIKGDGYLQSFDLHEQYPVKGGIGYYIKGNTVVYFDNIHIRKVEKDINKG